MTLQNPAADLVVDLVAEIARLYLTFCPPCATLNTVTGELTFTNRWLNPDAEKRYNALTEELKTVCLEAKKKEYEHIEALRRARLN